MLQENPIFALVGIKPFLYDVWVFDSGDRKNITTNSLDLAIKVTPKKSFKVTVRREGVTPKKLGSLSFNVAPVQSCWH